MKNKSTNYQISALKTPLIVVFLLGFLLYANTIPFGFVLDDKIVITGNQVTKKGFDGIGEQFFYDSMFGFWAEQYGVDVKNLEKDRLVVGGRYRPITLITHSIEYGLFKEKAGPYHFINAALYGLTAVLLFIFLSRILQIENINKWWLSIPFLATLLFVVHPLHVEVVANIKGRDEILSLLFGIWALDFAVRFIKENNNQHLIYTLILLFASFMAKETTVPFVAVIPLVLYFFTDAPIKKIAIPSGAALVVGMVYIGIRSSVVGEISGDIAPELMNDPFLHASTSQRYAIVFLTMTAYFKLLFIPHPLTHDYYPFHLPFVPEAEKYPEISNIYVWIGIIATIALLAIAVKGLKDKKLYSFAILFFFGTFVLLSNLFFPVGVLMSERFMYIPSIGFAIAMVWLVIQFIPSKIKGFKKETGASILLGVSLLFAVLSFNRNYAWESDASLALTDVHVSTGSAKANMAAGDALIDMIEKESNPQEKQRMIQEAFGYLKKSLEIYPEFFPPRDLLGKLYFEAGNYLESVKFYANCHKIKPSDNKFIRNIIFVGNRLIQEKKFDDAVKAYQTAIDLDPNYALSYKAMGELYGNNLQRANEASNYLSKANQLAPNDPEIIEKLGICMAMLGRHQEAINLFNNALKLTPNNANIYNNLAVVYKQLGNDEKAEQYLQSSQRLRGGQK